MDFSLRSQKISNEVLVLLPEGSIDSFSSEEFHKQFEKSLKKDTKALLLDLGKIKYISSVGLGAIITLMKKTKENNAYFAVYDPQISVRRVFEISKLDFLEVKESDLSETNPFCDYIRSEEPKREAVRKAREESRKKREEEISERARKEKTTN